MLSYLCSVCLDVFILLYVVFLCETLNFHRAGTLSVLFPMLRMVPGTLEQRNGFLTSLLVITHTITYILH